MQLKLFNSLSKKKENFIPLNKDKISMYVCGPTVYSAPHLGNGLSNVTFDILYRILVYKYGKEHVIYVRNLTDVDDKINIEAIKRNITINELTKEIIEIFSKNNIYLNCLKPNFEPKATEHIAEMIEIIKKLIARSYAYVKEGHVFFAVNKDPQYGKIADRKLNEMIAGARVAVSDLKDNPADFVLWKPVSKNDDISSIFDSPWGKGRPGWHIECSAMSNKYLGQDFDIHGGGVDLIFPHHTNEIAQSCNAFEGSKYANYWIHNGFLLVDGEKMSKSLGNFITIKQLEEQGVNGEVLRFALLSSHYRKPLNFSDNLMNNSKKTLDSFYRVIDNVNDSENNDDEQFITHMFDDLNTPNAIARMHDLTAEYYKASTDNKIHIAKKLYSAMKFLGLAKYTSKEWFQGDCKFSNYQIEELIAKRNQAKQDKNWILADEIREKLKKQNIILEDKNNGTTIWRKI